jgi:hypothetical protein
MQLNRLEAIKCLIEKESLRIHGYSSNDIKKMSSVKLAEVVNKVFEPIDLDDPYTVVDVYDLRLIIN